MNFIYPPILKLRSQFSAVLFVALSLLWSSKGTADSTSSPTDVPSPEWPRLLLPADPTTALQPKALLLSKLQSSRKLRLNPAFETERSDWLQVGRRIRLDLLENQDITVAIESVEATVTGGQLVRGRATSDAASSVMLTLEDGSLTGFIRLGGLGAYRIVQQGAGDLLEVSHMAPRAPGFCGTVQSFPDGDGGGGIAHTSIGRQAGGLPPADTQTEPTVVDVLFLYTPQAVIGEGNEGDLRRRIVDSVEETNHRLTNSLINVRIHPISIDRIDYTETGDLPLDLSNLRNATGGLGKTAVLRNDFKADLVVMVTELENQGLGGAAFNIALPTGSPFGGFAVVRRVFMGRGSMVLAHELGHLMGCAHDREHSGFDLQSDYAKARKPYMYGYRFEVEGVTYVDVMSYLPGIYVPYFGNPRLSLDGVPLGVSAESVRPSDGARTINETAPYVAQYRLARSRVEFAQSQVVVSEQEGSASVRLLRSGDLSTSTRVTVVFDSASSARPGNGQDYTLPVSTQVLFDKNQATADLIIPLLADDFVEGVESVKLNLESVLGEHGLGSQWVSELVILDASTPAAYSQVEFPDGPLSVIESAGQVMAQVAYTGPAGGEDSVIPYRTADGTAVAGRDYQAVSGFLTNGLGVASWEIPIPLLTNPEAGPDRTFSLVVGTRTNEVRILDEQRVGALHGNPGRDLVPDGDLNARVRGDGKLLVWGSFSRLAGQERTGIALLNADGSVDDGFRPPEFLLGHRRLDRVGNAGIGVVEVQEDGKLVLAGNFSRVDGQPRTTLVRLNSNGSVDEDFARNLRFDGAVADVAIQPDGRILVGGPFEHINDIRRPYIARLKPDGTMDESFQPNGGPTSDWTVNILTIALQADGKILMGGFFKQVDDVPMLNLARLNSDGTFDSTFQLKTGASGPVMRIRPQPDGKIVVGGVFDSVGGRVAKKLTRLNADGSNDLTFQPPHPNADVNDFVCLPDGRLLVKGNFTSIAGKERRFLAFLNPDGSLESDFDFGIGPDLFLGSSEATPLLADGTLFLSGTFRRFNGLTAPNLVRLNLGELAPRLQSLRPSASEVEVTVQGLPGGFYPLESSHDLEHWEPAGEVRFEGYRTEAEVTVKANIPELFLRTRSRVP